MNASAIATIAKTTPTISDRCAIVLTTGGAVRSRCFMGAALISDLPRFARADIFLLANRFMSTAGVSAAGTPSG